MPLIKTLKNPKALLIAGAVFLVTAVFGIYFAYGPSSKYPEQIQNAKASASWYNSGWSYRKQITIDNTKVDNDLTNFPVLINLSSDSSLAANALASGNDILFTSSDGTTKLDHEIETYTSGSGALVAWVKVPSLSNSVDTELYMYYGNSGALDQQAATDTWDANYLGVWHMDETSGAIDDSSINNYNGNRSGGELDSVATSSQVGFGQALVSSTISTSLNIFSTMSGSFTAEAWINNPNSGHGWGWIFGGNGWVFLLGKQELESSFHVNIGGIGSWSSMASAEDAFDGNWHHIVGVYDGSNALIYVDGVQTSLGAEDITNTGGFPSQLKIGNSLTSNSDNYFSGVIDDVRVYTRALSYSEIQEVYSFGEVTTNATCVDSDGGLNYYVKGTTNAAYPGGGGEVLGDYCNGGVLYESYCGEVEPEALYTQYNCLNGCSNGACLPESNESNITSCVDSDGGNDYYTKGYTSGDLSPFGDGYEGQFGTVYDFCIQLDENGIYPWINESGSGNTWNRYEVAYCEKNCAIYEMSCKNSEIWTNVPTCPSGCSDGACVEKQGVAKYIIEKNISNFVFTHTGFMSDWDLDNCEFFEFEGGIENLPYGDSCINELGDYYYNNIDYLEIVYNNVDILIEVHKIKVSSDNFDNLVKGISNTGYSSLNYESILGNEVVLLTFEDSNSESLTFLWPSNEKIIGISLVDNKYLSDSDLEEFLGAYLTKFPSTLSKIECIPRYYCTVSPTICPSNGVQVKRCEDFECNSGSYEEKVSCNPGQCYGCELDGECIPYGFRTQVTLYNDEPGNYNLYCEINGRLEQQKPSIPGKDWPKCQNSYECESNICSGGECLPVSQAIRDSGKIAQFVFSILCKIANPLSDEEYNQCMINFLGE